MVLLGSDTFQKTQNFILPKKEILIKCPLSELKRLTTAFLAGNILCLYNTQIQSGDGTTHTGSYTLTLMCLGDVCCCTNIQRKMK